MIDSCYWDPGGGWPLGQQGWTAWRILANPRRANCRSSSRRRRMSSSVLSVKSDGNEGALDRSLVPRSRRSLAYRDRHAAAVAVRARPLPRRQAHPTRLRPRRLERCGRDRRDRRRRGRHPVRARHAGRSAQPGYTLARPGQRRLHRKPRPDPIEAGVDDTFQAERTSSPATSSDPRPGVGDRTHPG